MTDGRPYIAATIPVPPYLHISRLKALADSHTALLEILKRHNETPGACGMYVMLTKEAIEQAEGCEPEPEAVMFRGGSSHMGPCVECVNEGRGGFSMAGTWEGDEEVYRCVNGHEVRMEYRKA
jgi:hypothetical protein